MPMYVLNRNATVSTMKGHRIRFEKDEPVFVPPICIPDVVAVGATPADGTDPDLDQDVAPGIPAAANDPVLRAEVIQAAIIKLVATNERGTFGADNAPKADAISTIVGFKVDNKERNVAWRAYHDAIAEENQ